MGVARYVITYDLDDEEYTVWAGGLTQDPPLYNIWIGKFNAWTDAVGYMASQEMADHEAVG